MWMRGGTSKGGYFLAHDLPADIATRDAFLLRSMGVEALADPIAPLALLIVGSSGVISNILPYTAENYPLRIRWRATGWIAGCSKLGGLAAQGLSVLGAAPALGVAAAFVGGLAVVALGMIAVLGRETRGRDLRDLEIEP